MDMDGRLGDLLSLGQPLGQPLGHRSMVWVWLQDCLATLPSSLSSVGPAECRALGPPAGASLDRPSCPSDWLPREGAVLCDQPPQSSGASNNKGPPSPFPQPTQQTQLRGQVQARGLSRGHGPSISWGCGQGQGWAGAGDSAPLRATGEPRGEGDGDPDSGLAGQTARAGSLMSPVRHWHVTGAGSSR